MSALKAKLERFRGRRVLVVGMGRSGVGAARLLAPVAAVTACDAKPAAELGDAPATLAAAGVEVRAGDQTPALLAGRDLIVRSPGVPWSAPLLVAAREAKVEVIGELELACRLLPTDRLVAVTGSNGKSTTAALLGDVFRRAGQPVVVAGNIGVALTAVLPEISPRTTVVAEVSSFQLEDIVELKPRVAILLNLAPDHLDRHGSAEEYYRMKWRLFMNQDRADYAVLNRADAGVMAKREVLEGQVLTFGGSKPGPGVWLEGGVVSYDVNGARGVLFAADELRLPGPHNLSNAMAAAAAALALGVPAAAIAAAAREFPGLPHRLEPAGEVAGVRYVNDSKATNVASAVVALASFDAPLVLIAGGKGKGESFAPLAAAARERGVRAAVLYGAAREELAAAFAGLVPCEEAATVPEAVVAAARRARPGDVVLLAPACTSWDQYANFEERGDDFKRAVARLGGGAR
jgi:UDP-N-acetylmuramoylalanine--D-glutamate ligase